MWTVSYISHVFKLLSQIHKFIYLPVEKHYSTEMFQVETAANQT